MAIWLRFSIQISMRYRKLFSPVLQTLHPVKPFSLFPSDDDLHSCISICRGCLKISIAWQCIKRTIVGVFFVSGSLSQYAFLCARPRHQKMFCIQELFIKQRGSLRLQETLRLSSLLKRGEHNRVSQQVLMLHKIFYTFPLSRCCAVRNK